MNLSRLIKKKYRSVIIVFLLIIMPLFISGAEDNYLFNDKETCLRCIKEINEKKTGMQDECYKCKGRYGNKPGNKYYIEMTSGLSSKSRQEFVYEEEGKKGDYSLDNDLVIRKQQGMKENRIMDLCPDTYKELQKTSINQ